MVCYAWLVNGLDSWCWWMNGWYLWLVEYWVKTVMVECYSNDVIENHGYHGGYDGELMAANHDGLLVYFVNTCWWWWLMRVGWWFEWLVNSGWLMVPINKHKGMAIASFSEVTMRMLELVAYILLNHKNKFQDWCPTSSLLILEIVVVTVLLNYERKPRLMIYTDFQTFNFQRIFIWWNQHWWLTQLLVWVGGSQSCWSPRHPSAGTTNAGTRWRREDGIWVGVVNTRTLRKWCVAWYNIHVYMCMCVFVYLYAEDVDRYCIHMRSHKQFPADSIVFHQISRTCNGCCCDGIGDGDDRPWKKH